MFLRCLSRDKLTVCLNYMLVCNTVLWMKLHNWMLICYPVTSTMKIRKQNPDLKSGFSLGKQKWWQHCFNGHYWRINCCNKTYVWSTLFLCFCCVLYWQLFMTWVLMQICHAGVPTSASMAATTASGSTPAPQTSSSLVVASSSGSVYILPLGSSVIF